jgi:3-hydroxyisobutyrate dehydrogenase
MTNISFIGLGHMGKPMAINLLKHGHTLRVFDIAPESLAELAALGAAIAKSPVDTLQDVDVVITMVQNGEQVKSILTGEQGLFQHTKSGTLFIDCSSIDIPTSRLLHEAAAAHGFAMVDAPVSGGTKGAEVATLTFMVGGSAENFQRAQPILSAMGKKMVHAGAAGNGQAAKICNNMLLGISMIGVCEAFNLAEKLGLDAQKLFEISSNASGQCWSLTVNPPVPGLVETAPANRDYQPGFMAKMMLKDLLLSQNAAQYAGANTPLGAKATELYTVCVEHGLGDKDFSAMIQFIKDI